MSKPFKTCPFCSATWSHRAEFLADIDLDLVGYQANFEELALGLLLFNHRACNTTLAIRADRLRDLYIGPVFRQRRTGQTDCPGYCLKRTQLSICPAQCECAWVRRILDMIRRWPKPAPRTQAGMR